MKLFFIYCLLVVAGSSFVTFYNNNDAWHALIIGISLYVLVLFIVRDKESK